MAIQFNKDGINTGIGWCDYTANLWWGCKEVHEGCYNCYARVFANRFGVAWGNDSLRMQIRTVYSQLSGFSRKAMASGKVKTVFVGSMMDIFEPTKPMMDNAKKPLAPGGVPAMTGEIRLDFMDRLSRGHWPGLFFLLLTKRYTLIKRLVPVNWLYNKPRNVMFGVSVSTQEQLIEVLERVPALCGKFFISMEPQLEKIHLPAGIENRVAWIIQGGESGNGRRPFDERWALLMQKEAAAAGIPYYFKQIDKLQEPPPYLMVRQFPDFKKLAYE